MGYNFTTLTWASNGDHWRKLRKLAAVEILSSHRLQLLSDIRADEINVGIRGSWGPNLNERNFRVGSYTQLVLSRRMLIKRVESQGNVRVLVAAGIDTSSATMEWAMSLLVNNPEILEKAQSEIDIVVGRDNLVAESDIPKLPYLRCIINEVMRLYPVGLLLHHESSEECSVGGYRVPRGTMLLVNLWGIQNDPRIWEEPRKFKPERFEGCRDGVRDGFKCMHFGLGKRSCNGEGMALRMIGLTLASLLQCFEWKRVGKEMVDVTEGGGLTIPKAQPLLVECRPRPSMVNLLSQV
ncbi:hypothetical protein JCGZ_16063 [Jatropha curcas]|uniref:Cytochrome P450 n=1 Tax=Jatropha curcas TaxID=180498 RepID=A0A067KZN0_JATCU|nr:hypothetical protein JCGZ_16063 [Jatropha curcas]